MATSEPPAAGRASYEDDPIKKAMLVPKFNIHGFQDRIAFKDLSKYKSTKANPEWHKKPNYNTRTEMFEARQVSNMPHISYDVDGDGVVGSQDLVIAKYFDKDHKGSLTADEQKEMKEAVANGFVDRFMWGVEQSGAKRPFPVSQKRGLILSIDNGDAIGATYPEHPLSKHVPKHETQTEMNLDRKATQMNAANHLKETYDNKYPFWEKEQEILQAGWDKKPTISNIKQRAQADHEESRIQAGLYPQNSQINPDRECLHPGLDYVDQPVFRTRSQLMATRKEVLNRDHEMTRKLWEHVFIPADVRLAQRQQNEYEFRRVNNGETLSKLQQDRKRERVEYDMYHFGVVEKQLPRWSDMSDPWYEKHREATGSGKVRSVSLPPRAKDPDFKVTQVSLTGRVDPRPKPPPSDRPNALEVQKAGHHWSEQVRKTIPSWTTQQILNGGTRNGARLFDNLEPARCYAKDLMPLDSYSSFDLIRSKGLRAQAQMKKKNTEKVEESKLNEHPSYVGGEGENTASSPSRCTSFGTASVRSAAISRPATRLDSKMKNNETRVDASMLQRFANKTHNGLMGSLGGTGPTSQGNSGTNSGFINSGSGSRGSTYRMSRPTSAAVFETKHLDRKSLKTQDLQGDSVDTLTSVINTPTKVQIAPQPLGIRSSGFQRLEQVREVQAAKPPSFTNAQRPPRLR